MPRDSSGNYSLPAGSLVNTGDTILVSQHNPPFQDIANALTNSLDRTGNGPMLADLPMNNNRITGMAPGVDPTDAATVSQLTESDAIPLGAVIDFWGTFAPDNYMFCYGQAVSRTTYADLFAIIGTNAGPGDGSTTFNLPDYRGRVGVGRDTMGGSAASRMTTGGAGIAGNTLGAAGGSQTHTLTTAQLAAHTHSGTTDSATTGTAGTAMPVNESGGGAITQIEMAGHTHAFTTSSAGGGEAHTNTQPSIICNKIMRVL